MFLVKGEATGGKDGGSNPRLPLCSCVPWLLNFSSLYFPPVKREARMGIMLVSASHGAVGSMSRMLFVCPLRALAVKVGYCYAAVPTVALLGG